MPRKRLCYAIPKSSKIFIKKNAAHKNIKISVFSSFTCNFLDWRLGLFEEENCHLSLQVAAIYIKNYLQNSHILENTFEKKYWLCPALHAHDPTAIEEYGSRHKNERAEQHRCTVGVGCGWKLFSANVVQHQAGCLVDN